MNVCSLFTKSFLHHLNVPQCKNFIDLDTIKMKWSSIYFKIALQILSDLIAWNFKKFHFKNSSSEFCVTNWAFECLFLIHKVVSTPSKCPSVQKFHRLGLKMLNFIQILPQMSQINGLFVHKLFIHKSNFPSWRVLYWLKHLKLS